jgi:hypothetical protein
MKRNHTHDRQPTRPATIEPLEGRQMMSVTTPDADLSGGTLAFTNTTTSSVFLPKIQPPFLTSTGGTLSR